MLEVRELAFGYGSLRVGSGASFTLDAGDVMCLLGPNGSGKTTLFKTVLGLLRPLGGTVRVDGEPVDRMSRARIARLLGYVPQAHNAYFPFTVIEAVLMGRTAHLGPFAMPTRADRAVAVDALETLNLGHLQDAVYTRISGGERQLALIARALAQQPRFLVMDEPTASLDFGNQMLVLEQIRRLSERGLGVILSTHDPDHAFLCASQVAMLHGGRIAHQGPPDRVITPGSLRELYGVEVDVVELAAAGATNRVCLPARR